MDGVFMRKQIKRIGICAIAAVLIWTGGLIRDRQALNRELIRLHVVGATDTDRDQEIKLQVKDAVVKSLQEQMENLTDVNGAKDYLRENLPKIEALANCVLNEAGCADVAQVSLGLEEFSARIYDTFTLPAGVYQTLRITIGNGKGKNWWCVAFPSLCLPATTEGFDEAASCAGFSDALTGALDGSEHYEIRFYFLDLLGKLGNLLHRG